MSSLTTESPEPTPLQVALKASEWNPMVPSGNREPHTEGRVPCAALRPVL